MEQMEKHVEDLDPSIQSMILEIMSLFIPLFMYRQLMNNQQKLIDELGIPDTAASEDTLQSLQDLQFVIICIGI